MGLCVGVARRRHRIYAIMKEKLLFLIDLSSKQRKALPKVGVKRLLEKC
ncbi:MAG: hypothetical protein HWQ35_17960 [Nostoc sp. NMS1]|nr:hypothetical protein [Nostoc sp. NMS1]MBN3908352.1 hypothetical protein [Nostoc sp. NMS1]